MKRYAAWLSMMLLVVACSDPEQGPPLGAFAAIKKTETDAPFSIVPPSSRSPAPFTYTSSNAAVAVVAGSLLIIKGPGESTITAAQGALGGWGPTSASTTLTVSAVPVCVAPATLANNQCQPPSSAARLVTANYLAWTGASFVDTWTQARAYCASITVEGRSGWRLPAKDELAALQAGGALAGQNWTLGPTWSSTMVGTSSAASHLVVDLGSGEVAERPDVAGAYITCVR